MRILTCLLVLAACGGDELATEQAAIQCPIAYCGSNSATIDHYGFHELDLDGSRNKEGFRILGMSAGSNFYDLDVTRGRIVGYFKHTTLSGPALQGARIYLDHKNGRQYAITIAEVTYASEVVPPFNTIETYRFEWATIMNNHLPYPVHAGDTLPIPGFDKRQDVCPTIYDPGGSVEWDEAAQMPVLNSLVFEGDRIDVDVRTVAPTPDPRWFNIGCGRDTLVKLRLTRSTLATTKRNWRLVQATLKMLSADYCGTGKAFTMRGEPLVWRSLSGMELRSSPTSFEARWDETGARCLDTPRALDTRLPYLAASFPDIETEIANECARPPPCANVDPAVYDAGDLVISGNRDL